MKRKSNISIMKELKKYKKKYPEMDEIMKKFHISQDAYNRARALIGTKIQSGSISTLATYGDYNADISQPT